MLHTPAAPANATRETILERTRALAPRFAERAHAAEESRRIPPESVDEMLEAGFARILLPKRIGGYGLGFDTLRIFARTKLLNKKARQCRAFCRSWATGRQATSGLSAGCSLT